MNTAQDPFVDYIRDASCHLVLSQDRIKVNACLGLKHARGQRLSQSVAFGSAGSSAVSLALGSTTARQMHSSIRPAHVPALEPTSKSEASKRKLRSLQDNARDTLGCDWNFRMRYVGCE
jgi:hypothetical protein